MSSINGDKARFHKKRKDGIARRARNRARLSAITSRSTAARPASAEKKPVSA